MLNLKLRMRRNLLLMGMAGLISLMILLLTMPLVYPAVRTAARQMTLRSYESYTILESDSVTMYFLGIPEEEVLPVLKEAERTADQLKKLLHFDRKEKIPLILHDTQESLKRAGKIKSEGGVLGFYRSGVIHLASPRLYQDRESMLKSGVMPHEMMHYMLDFELNGNCPLWFTEGMALFSEKIFAGTEIPEPDFVESMPYETFKAEFGSLDKNKSYYTAYTAVMKMTEEYGPQGLFRLLEDMKEGKTLEKAFRNLSGEKLESFFRERIM